MSGVIRVDEIEKSSDTGTGIKLKSPLQDSSGNQLISETGAISNVDLSAVDFSTANTSTFSDDQISGDKIHGGTISNFASTGIVDESTSQRWTFSDTNLLPYGSSTMGIGDDSNFFRYINDSPAQLYRYKTVVYNTRTSMWIVYSGSLNSNFIVSYAITYSNYVFGGMWQMNVSHSSQLSIHGMANSVYGTANIGVSYDAYGSCVLSFTPTSGSGSQGTLASTIQCFGNCYAVPYDGSATTFSNDYNSSWS